MTFTRSVKVDRRRDPASAEPWATNDRRWPGRKPSGQPEAPVRKDMIAFLTSSSVATAGTTDPSGGSGRLRFSGAEGCFSFKAPKSISILWCQTLCRCQLPNCSLEQNVQCHSPSHDKANSPTRNHCNSILFSK